MRLAAGIEYNGYAFSGWQSQHGVRTVQDSLEYALEQVAAQPVRVVTAGRTDTGVHASGQVVHFECERIRSEYSWFRGVNTYLPKDVRMTWVKQVPVDFHARFSAIRRHYRYIVFNGPTHPAIFFGLVAWIVGDLDIEAMQAASTRLIGRHDFSAFRAAGCQSKTAVRNVNEIYLNQSGPWIWLDISADGFLQHMVRNVMGTLVKVGKGEKEVSWVGQVLESKDRTLAGATAVSSGLYLSGVEYPAEYQIPSSTSKPRFW